MRMRREACHNGVARIGQAVREGGHFIVEYPGVDEQNAGSSGHDNGVALAELALVDQHTLRDLPQHGRLLPLVVCNRLPNPEYGLHRPSHRAKLDQGGGAPGAGMTPSCCIIPRVSMMIRLSAILPSVNRSMVHAVTVMVFPVGGMPRN